MSPFVVRQWLCGSRAARFPEGFKILARSCCNLPESRQERIIAGQLLTHLDHQEKVLEEAKNTNTLTNADKKLLTTMATISQYHQSLRELLEEEAGLKDLISAAESPDLMEMASKDLAINFRAICDIIQETSRILLPDQKYDGCDATLEVLPGAGGMEASIFAEEIFTLYTSFARGRGMRVELQEFNVTTTGGIYKAVAGIRGLGAFKLLKYECGVHRVQRVPRTGSKNDRLQTSTCSVAVLPVPEDKDFQIPKNDLRVEYTRSSGAGGQGVNTSDSACRVTHVPTGTMVKCQEERSPKTNHDRALSRLTAILFEKEFQSQIQQTMKFRKSQIGNMDRNEKIRTYNFSRHTLADHRLSENRQFPNISSFLRGELGFETLDEFREKLSAAQQIKGMSDFLSSNLA